MRLLRSVCTSCGFTGAPTSKTEGSFAIEVILWFFFMVPGLVYSLWRLGSKHEVCPYCRRPAMIPAASPTGQDLVLSKGGWSPGAEVFFINEARSQWRGRLLGPTILSLWTIASFTLGYEICGIISAVILVLLGYNLARDWPRGAVSPS